MADRQFELPKLPPSIDPTTPSARLFMRFAERISAKPSDLTKLVGKNVGISQVEPNKVETEVVGKVIDTDGKTIRLAPLRKVVYSDYDEALTEDVTGSPHVSVNSFFIGVSSNRTPDIGTLSSIKYRLVFDRLPNFISLELASLYPKDPDLDHIISEWEGVTSSTPGSRPYLEALSSWIYNKIPYCKNPDLTPFHNLSPIGLDTLNNQSVCVNLATVGVAIAELDGVETTPVTTMNGDVGHMFFKVQSEGQRYSTVVDPTWNIVAPQRSVIAALRKEGASTGFHETRKQTKIIPMGYWGLDY